MEDLIWSGRADLNRRPPEPYFAQLVEALVICGTDVCVGPWGFVGREKPVNVNSGVVLVINQARMDQIGLEAYHLADRESRVNLGIYPTKTDASSENAL